MIPNAMETVLNMPTMTLGQWGGGTKGLQSAFKLASILYNNNHKIERKYDDTNSHNNNNNNLAIVIVPQANLVAKVSHIELYKVFILERRI